MITLQYLQELGTFTLELIKDLKSGKQMGSLKLRDGERSTYFYNNYNLLTLIRPYSDGLQDSEIIAINGYFIHKLTLVKHDLIDYSLDLEKYSTASFEEDWFALSTVLSSEEIIELYLVRTVQDMIISTSSTDRILFNPSLILEYYKNERRSFQ